jgi:hypothetical protein
MSRLDGVGACTLPQGRRQAHMWFTRPEGHASCPLRRRAKHVPYGSRNSLNWLFRKFANRSRTWLCRVKSVPSSQHPPALAKIQQNRPFSDLATITQSNVGRHGVGVADAHRSTEFAVKNSRHRAE